MKPLSFRIRIIGTVTILIIAISYGSFFLLTERLSETIRENSEQNVKSLLSVIKDNYIFSLTRHGGKILYPLLTTLSENHGVEQAWLFRANGQQIFSTKPADQSSDSSIVAQLAALTDSISLQPVHDGKEQKLRAFLRIDNRPACYGCHEQNRATLGFVAIDFSMHELSDNVALVRRFGFFFTITLLLILLMATALMHYRSVKNSLNRFQNTMNLVEDGDLNARVPIASTKELGQLGRGFNQMLNKVQEMQEELADYHQKEMMNAQKLATVGEMAAGVAHEIKNPLTGISNAIEIIVNDIHDQNKKPVLEEIHRQVKRVNKTINDLLQFSRPIELVIEEGNINQLIRSAVFFLESQTPNKKINFVTKLKTDIPLFKFDHKQIENVIINLGQNATQAIADKGVIILSTDYDESENLIFVKIEDSGCGIPQDNLALIRKPFFTTRSKGTGLGLSISEDIIQRHNGQLSVESAVEHGTVICFTLPAIEEKHRDSAKLSGVGYVKT